MAFLLADSFQSSLEKLSREEQKAAKLAAFELQINPANPGLQCHRLDNIKDKNFWSARASRDIRLLFHRVESSLMLCYVAHHDPAFDWASRRKIETHPVTGAAQIVEIRETVQGPSGSAFPRSWASTLACTHASGRPMDVIPSRVFMNGNSQAVRIPAEFRLATDRVQISRTLQGDLLIHPCSPQRGKALIDLLGGFDADFVTALEQQQAEKLPLQERESL